MSAIVIFRNFLLTSNAPQKLSSTSLHTKQSATWFIKHWSERCRTEQKLLTETSSDLQKLPEDWASYGALSSASGAFRAAFLSPDDPIPLPRTLTKKRQLLPLPSRDGRARVSVHSFLLQHKSIIKKNIQMYNDNKKLYQLRKCRG